MSLSTYLPLTFGWWDPQMRCQWWCHRSHDDVTDGMTSSHNNHEPAEDSLLAKRLCVTVSTLLMLCLIFRLRAAEGLMACIFEDSELFFASGWVARGQLKGWTRSSILDICQSVHGLQGPDFFKPYPLSLCLVFFLLQCVDCWWVQQIVESETSPIVPLIIQSLIQFPLAPFAWPPL